MWARWLVYNKVYCNVKYQTGYSCVKFYNYIRHSITVCCALAPRYYHITVCGALAPGWAELGILHPNKNENVPRLCLVDFKTSLNFEIS